MSELKKIQNNLRTVVVFAVIKQFRKAAIIQSVIDSVRSNDLIATGSLSNPESSFSIIPNTDDRWLVPRKGERKKVSVRVYGSRLSDGTQFPSSVKIKIDLGKYGLSPRYKSLATDAPEGPYISNFFNKDRGDMIDRIMNWMDAKMDRGHLFYYTDNNGNERPLRKSDKVNKPRAAFPIMRKISREGPNKVDFASAFNKVEGVLRKSSEIIEEATYFEVVSPNLRKSIENIF